ncbi:MULTISPECIES: DUF5071 domain-containing protein [unclassified Bradyrhizobium]|uniref:DUF5071 domain-containing protein n=1 Tax=unclassified Bradyrhizobium TaxID=2631580 RepID=UPI0028E97F5F|nr:MULTISPECIES: DUF5071 domain-containing protein [unclassified Bradyrhizobium]
MDDIHQLIPKGKADLDRARAAVQAGYPAVAPILPELTAWLKDYNWPVAHILAPFLASIGAPMAPHIWHVLNSDDAVWKYWILQLLIPFLPEDVALQFLPELRRLCSTPSEDERQEGLDQQARDALAQFGLL